MSRTSTLLMVLTAALLASLTTGSPVAETVAEVTPRDEKVINGWFTWMFHENPDDLKSDLVAKEWLPWTDKECVAINSQMAEEYSEYAGSRVNNNGYCFLYTDSEYKGQKSKQIHQETFGYVGKYHKSVWGAKKKWKAGKSFMCTCLDKCTIDDRAGPPK